MDKKVLDDSRYISVLIGENLVLHLIKTNFRDTQGNKMWAGFKEEPTAPQISGLQFYLEHNIAEMKHISFKAFKDCSKLEYYKTTTVGLYAIDKHPNDVDIEWIRKNYIQLK